MGHLIGYNSFKTNIIEGRINGCNRSGKPRKTFIGEMIEMTGCDGYSHMKTLALKRESGSLFFLRQGLAFKKKKKK